MPAPQPARQLLLSARDRTPPISAPFLYAGSLSIQRARGTHHEAFNIVSYMGSEDGIILYGDNVCPVYGF